MRVLALPNLYMEWTETVLRMQWKLFYVFRSESRPANQKQMKKLIQVLILYKTWKHAKPLEFTIWWKPSIRMFSSSHFLNSFVVLADKNTDMFPQLIIINNNNQKSQRAPRPQCPPEIVITNIFRGTILCHRIVWNSSQVNCDRNVTTMNGIQQKNFNC